MLTFPVGWGVSFMQNRKNDIDWQSQKAIASVFIMLDVAEEEGVGDKSFDQLSRYNWPMFERSV